MPSDGRTAVQCGGLNKGTGGRHNWDSGPGINIDWAMYWEHCHFIVSSLSCTQRNESSPSLRESEHKRNTKLKLLRPLLSTHHMLSQGYCSLLVLDSRPLGSGAFLNLVHLGL